MTVPVPVRAISPAAIRACSVRAFRSFIAAAEPGPCCSMSWIDWRRATIRLQVVLLGLKGQDGLDERCPLQRRVADARPLRADLGSDQEPEREQGEPERHLPRRDR